MSHPHPAEPKFAGMIGRTVAESTPAWTEPRPPAGAPNVVLVVLDDTGFAHLGCYGSTIETPNIDRLAAEGLRFTGFHTTALCSSSRACLLTGRNHHAVGMRAVSRLNTGYPNTRGAVAPSAATIAQILRANGFATFAAGKWHLAPMAECTPVGPFHNWPLQKGFDRYYGFLQGATDHFHPELTADNHFVEQPRSEAEGYHLSEDLVDQSMAWMRDQISLAPERPFFLYLAFGATHAPHQAPKSYLDKYRGRFDAGWDEARDAWFARQRAMGVVPPGTRLAPRNPGVKPWSELSDGERTFAARLQEAFAAMLDHTDAQIGRLAAFLDAHALTDNTLFILTSDNGASQEGGPLGVLDELMPLNQMQDQLERALGRLGDIGTANSHSNIPWGWAQAGNTPLKWYKQNTHGGGVRDPLIVRWPARIADAGGLRGQFCHAIDLAPTILDLVGLYAPAEVAGVKQMPMHGASLAPLIKEAGSAPMRTVQYFEMFGHRGLWRDGWKAVTLHRPLTPFDDDAWELYRLDEDFSETRNLAEAEPARLAALIETWWREAEAHGVLPLDDRPGPELFRASRRPWQAAAQRRMTYYPPMSHVVSDACPPVFPAFRMIVELNHPAGCSDGALVSRGSINSGFVFYISDGRCVFDYNAFNEHTVVAASEPLPPGCRRLELLVERRDDGSAEVALSIDGAEVAAASIPRLLITLSTLGMDFGRSSQPVSHRYAPPFVYAGDISRVTFELPEPGQSLRDAAERVDFALTMSRQ
jgi:arylsulfatase